MCKHTCCNDCQNNEHATTLHPCTTWDADHSIFYITSVYEATVHAFIKFRVIIGANGKLTTLFNYLMVWYKRRLNN